jgi:hypothetical protein
MPAEASQTKNETFVPIEWLEDGRVKFLDQTLLPMRKSGSKPPTTA